MHVRVLLEQRPVDPTGFVVLAIGVVVAALCVTDFVAHQDHRHAQREQGNREEVFYLAIAELLHSRIVARAFDSAIPAPVVVRAVAVFLAVRIVVLVVIRAQGGAEKALLIKGTMKPFDPFFLTRTRQKPRKKGK